MNAFLYFLLFISGACLVVSLLHAAIYLRRRSLKVHLVFSIMTLCAAISSALDGGIYHARDVAGFVFFLKASNTFQVILWIAFVWFIRSYTGNRRWSWMVYLVSGLYTVAGILNLVFHHGLLFETVGGIDYFDLPWGERLAFGIGPANAWRFLPDLAWLLLLVYAAVSCILLYRNGQRSKAVYFGVSLFACLGIGYLHGTIIDFGLLPPPSVWNLTFLALIILMSNALVGQVVQVPVLSRQLAEEQTRMDLVVSTMETGLILMDRNLNVVWSNKFVRQSPDLGNPVEQKCYTFAENWDSPCDDCSAVKTLADGRIHETVRYDSVNNSWYLIISKPVLDEKGNVAQVLESSTNITELKRAEAKVRQSEERYRIVGDNTYDWEFWQNPDGRMEYVSPSCERITGHTPESFLNDPGLQDAIVHPQDRKLVTHHRSRVEAQRRAGEAEFRVVARDGQVRWIGHVCQPVFARDGAYLGIRGSNRDVTQRKQITEARDQALAELEALKNQLEEENLILREELLTHPEFGEIVGRSNAMLYLLARVKQVAETDSTVLVHGETGVGKELIASAIHRASNRSQRPYIRVNCAALSPALVESELFGHQPGAFTGADKLRKGRFELANGGTLLLDEVSELSTDLQAKLLRVLQEGQFERVGGSTTLNTDVRVIATTNRNLPDEVANQRFRADLYYRLNVYPITVPPLAKRKDDIPLLVWHFLKEINARVGKSVSKIPQQVMDALVARDYPGNVRELKNLLERAIIISANSTLQLPRDMDAIPMSAQSSRDADDNTVPLISLDSAARAHIMRVLDHTSGRIEGRGGAAEILKIKPSTLRSRMRNLGIRRNKQTSTAN